VTSRIYTTNNRFKRSKKKVCFSENFCWQTKNIHNFLGDNTRFTPGIEAWSPATGKMGFRMDTKKNQIPKGKGYDPILTPGPNFSRYKSITGVENASNLIYFIFKEHITSVEYHIAQRFPRSFPTTKDARSIRTMCERQSKTVNLVFLVESLFQNYWFCLIKCTLECIKIASDRSPGRE